MNAERIVQTLLGETTPEELAVAFSWFDLNIQESETDPEEFMRSLPAHVFHKYRIDHSCSAYGASKVYLLGPGGSAFIGFIHPLGNRWYAYRFATGSGTYDIRGQSRDTPEDAANDLLAALEDHERHVGR